MPPLHVTALARDLSLSRSVLRGFVGRLFNLVRWLEAGSWRFHKRGADGFVVSVVANLGWYLCCSAMPLLWWRMPFFACPHIWAGGTIAAILSNAALLAAASHVTDVDADGALAAWAFEVIGACAGAEALGAVLVWANMVPRFRPTLYRRCTMQQYVERSRWEECPPSMSFGSAPNDSRARTLNAFTRCYWPRKAVVTAWLSENWRQWVDPGSRPHWFDRRWLDLFPLEWLPDGGKGVWADFVAQEEEEKEACAIDVV